jgi:hypothetical protein
MRSAVCTGHDVRVGHDATLGQHPRLAHLVARAIGSFVAVELALLTYEAIHTWLVRSGGDDSYPARSVAAGLVANVLAMVVAAGIGSLHVTSDKGRAILWLSIAAVVGLPATLIFALVEAALHN